MSWQMKIKAIIEITEGSKEKIEIRDGRPVLDRMLNRSCPAYYGYIPGTLAEDGDSLDVFVLADRPLKTCDTVSAKIVGIFTCIDNGIKDDKLVAVIDGEHHTEIGIWKQTVAIGDYLINYKPGFKVECYNNLPHAWAKKIIKKYSKKTGLLDQLINFFKG